MPRKEIDDFNFTFLRETEKAICVCEGSGDGFWIAKSLIEYEKDGKGNVAVTMPIWLAKEKGVAGY